MGKSCEVLEKGAKKAFEKSRATWNEMVLIVEELSGVTIKESSCWLELYADRKNLKYKEFEKRAKECADLSEQEEELRVRYLDVKMRTEKAGDVWITAEAKWKDCIHKQKK